MLWLPVAIVLFFCGLGYAEDTKFNDAIEKYVTNCKENMKVKGNVMMAYYYINPPTYGEIPSFNLANFNVKSELRNEKAESEILLKAACICTDIPINTFDYIVVPFVLNKVTKDALTLCMFHDDDTKYDDVFTFPVSLLSSWMMAQYMARMPRTLMAPASESSLADCIDYYGNPTTAVPNQNVCYYVNYAAFEEIEGRIKTVVKNAYYGPFLGSQYPDFRRLQDLAESETPILDFMTEFDYVLCSLIKTRSWLSSTKYKTGCRLKVFNKARKIVIVGCCCAGQNDPNCSEVTEAVRNNKTLCLDGELSGGTTSFYFASQCPFTATKNYERVLSNGITEDTDSFEHLQALSITSQPTIEFKQSSACRVSYATECIAVSVDVVHKGCCTGKDFCNLENALTKPKNLEIWYRGISPACPRGYPRGYHPNLISPGGFRIPDGAMARNKKQVDAPSFFTEPTINGFYLYSSQISDVAYNVSLGFLTNKNVEASCPEQTHHYNRQYYVITCKARVCDFDFNDLFFNYLHENMINNAIQQAAVPSCENGRVTLTTDNASIAQIPILTNTTRVIGLYCELKLQISAIRNKQIINVSFGPVMPKDCGTQKVMDGDKYTCCYKASNNISHIEPRCHYSTIMSIVMAQGNDSATDNETTTLDPFEPANHQNTNQGVYENADKCEQNNIGHVGKVSRRCYPGGHGCFHLNGLNDANEAVIASCIGRAEKYVASRKDAFDRYREALICLVEEAKGKCHIVHSGTRMRYLCCCAATNVKNGVASCAVDSNLLYNTKDYEIKYVEDFKDIY
uniref:SCP domain-containing protein n=1 Tax=Panagrellus redivivus TaxID=6233 RepID=A0A7E4ZY33_PANRE